MMGLWKRDLEEMKKKLKKLLTRPFPQIGASLGDQCLNNILQEQNVFASNFGWNVRHANQDTFIYCSPRFLWTEMSRIKYSPCILSKWWKGSFNPQRSKGKYIKNPTDGNSEWQKKLKLLCESMTSVHCLLTCSVPIPQFEQDTSPHLSIPQTSRKIEKKRDGNDGRKNRDRKEREHSTFTAHQENQPAIHRKWKSDWEKKEKLGA